MASHSTPAATSANGATLKPPSPLLTAAERYFREHGGGTPSPLSSSGSSIVSHLSLNNTSPSGPAIKRFGPLPADLSVTRDLRASVVTVSDSESVYSTDEIETFVSAVQSVDAERAVVVVDARTEEEIVEAVTERLEGPAGVVEVEELAAADAMPELKKTYQLKESKRSKLRRTLHSLKRELHVSTPPKSSEVKKPRHTASGEKYHHVESQWRKFGGKCKRAPGKCGKAVKWVVYLPKRTVDGVEGLSDKDREVLGKVVATFIVFSGALAGALCIALL